jgi:phosphohistidine phosphatase
VKLYLMRHAEAKGKQEDPQRPLSENGIREASKMSDFASRNRNVQVKVILHSGKLRAHQTADMMAAAIRPRPKVMDGNGLEPNADPEVWIDRALIMEEDVLLVGHLPHLGRLLACLLNRDENRETVTFSPAALVCLDRDDSGSWTLSWKVMPEILV